MEPFHRIFEQDPASEPFSSDDVRGDIDEPDRDGAFEAFRQAWRRGADLPDLFGRQPLALKAPVTPFGPHRKADLAKLETFLDRTGHLDLTPTEGPTGQPSIRLDDAIRDFQAERGLMVDGVVNPKGETHLSLVAELRSNAPAQGSGLPVMRATTTAEARTVAAARTGEGRRTTILGRQQAQAPKTPTDSSRNPTHRDAERQSMGELELPRRTHSEAERQRAAERKKRSAKLQRLERNARDLLNTAKEAQKGSRRARLNPLTAPFDPRVEIPNGIAALERYLDGKGGVVNHDPRWVLSHRSLSRSAGRNEINFERWMLLEPRDKNPQVKKNIKAAMTGLRDGEVLKLTKKYDGGFDLSVDKFSDHNLVFGTGFIRATGEFTFRRNGNVIEVEGTIEQKIDDPFDFKSGQVIDLILKKIKTDDLIFLEKFGRARIFTNRSVWKRRFKAKIRILTDPKTGKITKVLGFSERAGWRDAK